MLVSFFVLHADDVIVLGKSEEKTSKVCHMWSVFQGETLE